MGIRVARGVAHTNCRRRQLSSISRRFFVFTATLFRPRAITKLLVTSAAVLLFAEIPANALVSPTATVGATTGSFDVSASGAANYSIPVVVAPGTNGMQPKLALVYNSQSGNGLIGVGWGLAGLSVIYRCGATIEIDGFKGGVNYGGNDKFCLDGERLIKLAVNGSEYRTQRESLQRVIASDSTTNPANFSVTDKDGVVRQYAVAIDAAGHPGTHRLWVLSKIMDPSGNYLTIAYDTTDVNTWGDYRPSHIDYTANDAAGISAYNSVSFEYVDRSDKTPLYEAGSVIETRKLLSKITSKTGGTKVREYRLSYDNAGAVGRSRLVGVEECGTGSDSPCITATSFFWQGGGSAFGNPALWVQHGPSFNPGQAHYADVNGDGKPDLIFQSANNGFWVSLSTGSGFTPPALWVQHGGSFTAGQAHYPDLNADGRADLVFQGSDNKFWVSLSTGTGFMSPTSWLQHGGDFVDGQAQFADLNGDGKTDLIFQGNDNRFIVSLSTGTGFTSPVSWVQHGGGFAPGHAQYADLSGDGRADLIFQGNDNKFWVSLSTGTGFTAPALWVQHGPSFAEGQAQYADLNGDGKADLIFQANDNGFWASLSTGTGFKSPALWVQHGPGFSPGQAQYADVNGDGKADLIFQANDNGFWVSLSTGTAFTSPALWMQHGPGFSPGQAQYADVNGDGKADLIFEAADNRFLVSLANGDYPDLLVGVANGLGVTTDVIYLPLTNTNVYSKDSGSSYPYEDLQPATYVVSSHSASNGIGGVNTTTYHYAGLKTHLKAAASLGFRRTERTDPAGILHRTDYSQNREAGIDGTVAAMETYVGATRIRYITNSWINVGANCGGTGGTGQIRQTAAYEEMRDLNGALISQINTTTSPADFDSCGFPQTTVVDFNDGWRKTTTNTYQNDTVNWILGRVTQAQVAAEAPGQPAQTRTSSFIYRSDGLIQSETVEPGNAALSVSTNYDYDPTGNLKSKTVSGADIQTRMEQYDYGLQYQRRFLTKKTNALGHETAYEYDERNGQPTKMTDPNGLITQWDYDGFGRKGLEIRPNGKISTMSYQPSTDEYGNSGYSVLVNTEGAGDSQTFYDSLGRAYKWRTKGFGGTDILKRIQFDNLGRVIFKSHPEFNVPSTHGVGYEYDILGRVKKITEPGPTSRETATDYNGLTTQVTNALNQITVTVKNSQGKPTQVTEAQGTAEETATQYQYDPFLNLTKVTDPAGNETTMDYDIRGRKVGMHDPDMGAWSYEYDVLGEVKKQTDAKGQQITMGYDVLGRMTSRTTPEGQSTWTYDTGTKAIGKLSSVTSSINGPNSYQESYVYEPQLGLLSSTTYTIAGTGYTVGRSYDAFSRLETITYPSGYTIKQEYDPYGYLWMVKRLEGTTESLIWMTNVADAHARVMEEFYGNNVVSHRVYDHETNDLQTIQTGTGGSTNNIQDLSYTYDNLHNLRSRNDAITGLNETFDYDNLNRLKQATGAVSKIYAYNSIGNIITKSDVGTYSYPTNGVRPHAVTSVAGTVNASYTYDDNGNMLTGAGRTISYTSFNKPQSISGPSGNVTLAYDANYNRVQKFAGSKTTTYLGKLFEREVDGTLVKDKSYVYAGNSLVAIFTHRNNLIDDTKYVHTDHLGSVNVITDDNGAVVERLSYDPHGKRRQTNGQDATGPIVSDVNRGFTRHEHDDEVGLINMNARLYDPLLGRFITPDSMVDGVVGQGLNRYSYVRNNPLTLTDPTGNFSLKKLVRKVVQLHVRAYIASTYATIGYIASGGNFVGAIQGLKMYAESEKAYRQGVSFGDILKGSAKGFATTYAFAHLPVPSDYGKLGQMVGSGVNGYLQTGNSDGFWHGFAAGAIPQNLGIDAYNRNPWANVGIGIVRDGLRGYVIEGRDGIGNGIKYGQFNNALGHLVGFLSSGFDAPEFKNGAFVYEGSFWNTRGAMTFGNAISGPTGLSGDPAFAIHYAHERDHIFNPVEQAFGALYVPAHAVDLTVGYMGRLLNQGTNWYPIEEHVQRYPYSTLPPWPL